MSEKTKSKSFRIKLIILIAVVAAFVAVSISWVVFYISEVKPFKESADTYNMAESNILENMATYYEGYDNDDDPTWYYELKIPCFLNFDCEIMTSSMRLLSLDASVPSYVVCRSYYVPHLFKKDEYKMSVINYTELTVDHNITVDENMEFVSGDKKYYDEHYDKSKLTFDSMKDTFGEDAFK